MERANPALEEIECALDEIAAWLVALRGARITQRVLTLEGFCAADPIYWGIVPSIGRADGETRETLPSRDLQALAEEVFARLLPAAAFDKTSGHDVRDVARSVIVRSSDLSAHRRLELLGRFGRPSATV
ncbi:MAG TPA: hypothetical protein PLH75_03885 [Amaricoccus sp.]|uniref:hypothetical protein n=1 Tax=Amaricoccus sp. TaxID=1872485 RepID=UPI001D32E583|nr:hypothetical protein [Amaricoccus sp.]MCB1375196.1 hypothetical protein [Paracoccaceae bacterium]HPG21914.1 hypothetical protein [Amaricoccus sp.]HRW15259.1 hypothetical protein [Amaricoccus sp.]